MPNDEKNKNAPSILAWKNTAPITKMVIEGAVADASLATAITTIFIATGVIAGPTFLASVANPVGIAALFVTAVYFAVAAFTSYQQMKAMENVNGALGKGGRTFSDEELTEKLESLVTTPEVVAAFENAGFQKRT